MTDDLVARLRARADLVRGKSGPPTPHDETAWLLEEAAVALAKARAEVRVDIHPAPAGFEDWPVYRTSKVVRAAKVVEDEIGHGYHVLRLEGGLDISIDRIQGRVPVDPVGGFVVAYKDGYVSWSPAEAFEESATLIVPPAEGMVKRYLGFEEPGENP